MTSAHSIVTVIDRYILAFLMPYLVAIGNIAPRQRLASTPSRTVAALQLFIEKNTTLYKTGAKNNDCNCVLIFYY